MLNFWPRPANFNLWRTPTSVLQQHFEREWYDPQSDVRAALSWCDLSYEERNAQALRWERGNLQDLKQLVTAALRYISFTSGEFTSGPIYPVHLWLYWNRNGQNIQLDVPWDVEMNPDRRCWRRLCARINQHYQGAYDLPSGSRNDWIFPWVNYEPHFSTSRSATVELEVAHPTQHERLEAALYLRDWLTANAPDLLSDWF